MTLKEKLTTIFEASTAIRIESTVKRIDGEWEGRIVWKAIELPLGKEIASCEWEGFEDIEDCADDCIKYLVSDKVEE